MNALLRSSVRPLISTILPPTMNLIGLPFLRKTFSRDDRNLALLLSGASWPVAIRWRSPTNERRRGAMAAVRVVVQFTCDSAATAEQRSKELAERAKSVQQEPGCIQFEAFRSMSRPEQY